jgi:hypothetical protein
MQRLAIVVGTLLGLAVAALAALNSGSSASALQAGYLQYKCYRADALESTTREIKETYIQDQFEEKNVLIRHIVSFCSLTVQDGGAAQMTCYAIKDVRGQPRFRPVDVQADDGYGLLHLQLTKPYSLCEPTKQSISFAGASAEHATFPRVKCYRTRQTERRDGGKITIFATDKFDGKDVRLGRPALFCTEVEEKKSNAKNDDVDEATAIYSLPFEDHVSTLTAEHPRTDPPSECGRYDHSVWYSYTPSEKVDAYISTLESTYPTIIGVYTGSGKGDLDEVDCATEGLIGLEVDMKPGTKYWIMVGSVAGYGAGKLKFTFEVESACASSCPDPEPEAAGALETPEAQPLQIDPVSFTCYGISQRSPDEEIQISTQFGSYLIDVGRGILYCVEAEKCALDPVNTLAGEIGRVAGCYD